jgi:hypothetical protein
MTDFHGYPVRRLASGFLELDCLTTAGPRIVSLKYKGSNNLLAEAPEASLHTAYGDYRLLGGHRLWHAPESMPRSYLPDGEGLEITDVPGGLVLEGRVEAGSGIRKRLEVRLDPDQSRVNLIHTLINEGLWEVELAPWAITMFRLGGTAILPTCPDDVDVKDLLPNRHISLWPYSHLDDPRLQLEDEFILIRAQRDQPLFKIGTFNPKGWSAYWLDHTLFRKTFAVQRGLRHPDYDCNAEIYCDTHVIELESLGPLSKLAPGDAVSHTEMWDLYDTLEQDFLSAKMVEGIHSA